MILFFLARLFFFHSEVIRFYQIPQKDSTIFYFVYRVNANEFPVELAGTTEIRRVIVYGEVSTGGDIKAAFYREDTIDADEEYYTLVENLHVKREKKYYLKTALFTSGGLKRYEKEEKEKDLYPLSSLIPTEAVRFVWYFDSTGFLTVYSQIEDSGWLIVQSEIGSLLKRQRVYIKAGWNFIPVELKGLAPGNYRFVLKVRDYTREVIVPVLVGYKWTEKQWRYMIMAVRYIFSREEIDSLETAPLSKKKKLWDAFWKRRDPTPSTPKNEAYITFLRRFRYAEEHYRSIFGGALSDMGIIYVTLGPPDDVERHDFESNSPPYVIWYYYRYNLKFKFMDTFGIGEYELVEPPRYMLDEIMENIRK